MKVIAVNGSPRKNWNTATMLQHALDGASAKGAETELIHLYDYNYKGCISCFACKLKGGTSYGKCGYTDELTPVLEKIAGADAVIFGSPIYFGQVTGEMRSFMERLFFQYLVYDKNYSMLFPRKIPVGIIYTMNVRESLLDQIGYSNNFAFMEKLLTRVFGTGETLLATETYQFSDYAKYESSAFDADERKRRREEVFPEDCRKAYEMGVRFAGGSN